MPGCTRCTGPLGKRLAGATTVGLRIGARWRAYAIEGVVTGTPCGIHRTILTDLPRLPLPALIHLVVLLPALSVACLLLTVGNPRIVATGLYTVAQCIARLRFTHLLACLNVAGGWAFDTRSVHGGTRLVTRLGTLCVITAKCAALGGTVQLAAVLLTAARVAVRHTVTVDGIVLPFVLVVGDAIVAVDCCCSG